MTVARKQIQDTMGPNPGNKEPDRANQEPSPDKHGTKSCCQPWYNVGITFVVSTSKRYKKNPTD